MKLFRTIAASFLVLLGVMMIVTWGISSKSVEAIENGDAAAKLTGTLLESPEVADKVADKATDEVHRVLAAQFDSSIFDTIWGLAEPTVHSSIVNIIGSDFVADAAEAGASKAQAGLVAALTKEDRPIAPLLLTIDVSPRINARIEQIPTVGQYLPEITVPTVSLEVIDAQVFEDIRSAYSSAKWVATWFIWLGLLLIALGVLVAPRRAWFLARALLVAGVLVAAIGLTVKIIGANTLASLVPGGTAGGLGVTIEDLLSDTAIPTISNLLVALGTIALLLALVTGLTMRFLPGLRDRAQAIRDENAAPLVHEQGTGVDATAHHSASADTAPLPVTVGARGAGADSGEAPTASIPSSIPSSFASGEPAAPPAAEVDAPIAAPPVKKETPVAEQPAKKPVARKPAAKKSAAPKKPVAKKPASKTKSTPTKAAPGKTAAEPNSDSGDEPPTTV